MEIKKILITGMPRTATTQLQEQLSNTFRIDNFVEPFTVNGTYSEKYCAPVDDPYTWTSQQNNGILKLLANNLFTIDMLKLIKVGNFDLVVITKRKNLIECCLSLFVAQTTRTYHYTSTPKIDPFVCDLEFVKYWINIYHKFNDCINELDKLGTTYYTVYYEDYVSNREIKIADKIVKLRDSKYMTYITTSIPYKDLCINYSEVESIINTAIDHG